MAVRYVFQAFADSGFLGGNCRFYKEFNCGENRDAVEIWEGSEERPLECPGLSFTGDPKWFKSMKCMRD